MSKIETLAPGGTLRDSLVHSLDRLEQVVDQETQALTEHREIDLQEVNRRKSRALLELTRIARAVQASGADPALSDRVARLHGKLVRNQELLRVHLAAVREIADLLAGVISEAESDGTYSTRMAARFQ
jgi:flagellar biosynthesis/type III secretory pathway chaperone